MPKLDQSLHEYDLGQLEIIAELWGIDLKAPNLKEARQSLIRQITTRPLVEEVFESLSDQAQQALHQLKQSDNRQHWALFTRRYGEIREMGPGKRDRQKPHHHPVSTSETLWYRGLVARAFFETSEGPVEFAYLPDDLAVLLPAESTNDHTPPSRPATPEERSEVTLANDHVLDHACTLLAALRVGKGVDEIGPYTEDWPYPSGTLRSLLMSANLIDEAGQPLAQEVKSFLEMPRGKALLHLNHSWLTNATHNDLGQLPQLRIEGEWRNDPLLTRRNVMALLEQLDMETWWSLPAFISTVKTRQPDFQRPAGDYDSWYVKDQASGDFLRGFEHWDQVDGALLQYLVCGPLHWLGLVDLAAAGKDQQPLAFRFSVAAPALLDGKAPRSQTKEDEPITVDKKLQVIIPRLAPRAVRYQIARFCEWLPPHKHEYRYRFTPEALEQAQSQGLQVKQLLNLLRRHGSTQLPPNLVKALTRWQQYGTQATMTRMMVLQVSQPQILAELRESRAARFLGDPLGPTTITVKAGAWQQVLEALGEMGYLGELKDSDNTSAQG